MMKLNLSNNNLNGIVAFVKYKDESFYCIAEVEYWLMDSWSSYLEDEKDFDFYFDFIRQFKVNYRELCFSFPDVLKLGDEFDIVYSKPLLYIDFEKKLFVSYYYEQDLEEKVVDGWIGKYSEVYNLIPEEYRYWELKENT